MDFNKNPLTPGWSACPKFIYSDSNQMCDMAQVWFQT